MTICVCLNALTMSEKKTTLMEMNDYSDSGGKVIINIWFTTCIYMFR